MKQFKPNRKQQIRGCCVSISRPSNLQKSPKYSSKQQIKVQRLPHHQTQIQQEQQIYKVLQIIQYNLIQQQQRIQRHCQSLLKEIEEYYIGIFTQVEKQRKELELCIESQFNRTRRKLENYQTKFRWMQGQMRRDRKSLKNFKVIYHETEKFQIPTIVFQQADKQAINAIIASIHPIVQFSDEDPRLQFNKRHQEPQHDTIKSTNQQQQTSESMIKTIMKVPQNKQFLCEEQFEWGYKFPKAKRYAGINETIMQQPQSKQNSLLLPQIC